MASFGDFLQATHGNRSFLAAPDLYPDGVAAVRAAGGTPEALARIAFKHGERPAAAAALLAELAASPAPSREDVRVAVLAAIEALAS